MSHFLSDHHESVDLDQQAGRYNVRVLAIV